MFEWCYKCVIMLFLCSGVAVGGVVCMWSISRALILKLARSEYVLFCIFLYLRLLRFGIILCMSSNLKHNNSMLVTVLTVN